TVVRVERDLHLDGALDLCRVTSGFARARLDGRQQRLAVELVALAAGADEAVRFLARVGRGLWTGCGDVEGHTILGLVEDLRRARLEVLPLERDVVVRPEELHELDRLSQAAEPLRGLGPLG